MMMGFGYGNKRLTFVTDHTKDLSTEANGLAGSAHHHLLRRG